MAESLDYTLLLLLQRSAIDLPVDYRAQRSLLLSIFLLFACITLLLSRFITLPWLGVHRRCVRKHRINSPVRHGLCSSVPLCYAAIKLERIMIYT